MYGAHKMLAIFVFSKGIIGVPIVIKQIRKRFTVIRALTEGIGLWGRACIILFHSHKGVSLEGLPCLLPVLSHFV